MSDNPDPYRFYEVPAPDDWLNYYDDLDAEAAEASYGEQEPLRDPEREADQDWDYRHGL